MTAPTVELNHYTQGPPDAPAVLLGSALGTSLALWDSLATDLAHDFHVVRFDTRGHGSSPAPPGPYSMTGLAADVVALADELEIARFAYVGLSLGGALGLTLALEHPDRLAALVLCGTAPAFGTPATWHERAEKVAVEGTGPLVAPTAERWFTQSFRAKHPDEVEGVLAMLADTSPVGYAGCCEANAGYDVTDRLQRVQAPTLVLAGEHDPTAGPEVARALAEAVPGAELRLVEGAAHIVNVAAPEQVNAAVRAHLERHLPG